MRTGRTEWERQRKSMKKKGIEKVRKTRILGIRIFGVVVVGG